MRRPRVLGSLILSLTLTGVAISMASSRRPRLRRLRRLAARSRA